MALKSTNLQVAFTDTMTTHDSSYDFNFMHGKQVLDRMVSVVFSKINGYLTGKGFTRVDANTLKILPIDGQQAVLLCESYQLPDINQYLNVSMNLGTHSMYYATNNKLNFYINFIITDTLIQSAINGTTPSVYQQIYCEFPFTQNSSSEYDEQGNWKSTTDIITMNGNIIMRELTNDNILLFKGMPSQSNDLDRAMGIGKIGDDTFLTYAHSDNDQSYGSIKFIKNDLIYYTQSFMILNSGTPTTDGYITTAPIYLSPNDYSQTAQIIQELKLENALQTPYKGMCVHGGIYIIDDVEYLALHNNLLIQI